ncbi:hypothetical protein ROLI_044690 [Roseobacter fucihabitans]|uniref:Uncharacterized protein n=1 Tax=Roseobacter fucihabitans TaxID=1537242 RepID=A0ABZ2C1E2_9RHOB|nr:hypothetical protein [Roseobacter litoralis]MBC6963948.1 hypothetical protein [Roseobacter litoralis]MBC6963967.1 hypothetical protein [Roseobacter litoralis]
MNQSFVVVEPNPVVLMDLVGTLQHSFPAGSVASLASGSEIGHLLDQVALTTCFFVNGALISELAPDVVRTIIDAGGRIVSIGRSASDVVPATVLEIPFTTTMILEALSIDAPDLPLPQLEVRT